MSQFSPEQRLELLKSIRQQSATNDYLMNSRKQILQGTPIEENSIALKSTLLFRILLAIVLLVGFTFMTYAKQDNLKKTADTIVSEIEKDLNVVDTVQSFSSKIFSDINLEP